VSPARALPACVIAVWAGAAHAVASSASAPPAAVPAQWRTYDQLVQFHDLPKTYSCDELWYRFRDLLLTLGARAYMTITPYDCGYIGGGEARSPRVELKFQLPHLLRGEQTRYAEMSAVNRAVRLAPGTPHSLQAGDCELMKQLQDTLLAGLPVQVTAATFSCSGPGATFALTLEASMVAGARPRQGNAATTPHS
jgi:hypothetical protein